MNLLLECFPRGKAGDSNERKRMIKISEEEGVRIVVVLDSRFLSEAAREMMHPLFQSKASARHEHFTKLSKGLYQCYYLEKLISQAF